MTSMSDTQTRVVRTVEELKALEGQDLGVGKWHLVTQEQVNAFADCTGDHQWIHVDVERAKNSVWGGTIAHGYLTLSLLPLLGRERDGVKIDLGARMGVNYGSNRVRFISPVLVGKRIRVRTKLLKVEELPNCVQITYENTIEVEGSERPACVAETIGRMYF